MEDTNLKIFKELCDHIVQADFQDAQVQFMAQHKDKFEDTDENKLEYTEIHSQYVYILDEVIEGHLKVKYSEEEVKAFYDSFRDNMATYEAENKEGMEMLFTFLDFGKFKE